MVLQGAPERSGAEAAWGRAARWWCAARPPWGKRPSWSSCCTATMWWVSGSGGVKGKGPVWVWGVGCGAACFCCHDPPKTQRRGGGKEQRPPQATSPVGTILQAVSWPGLCPPGHPGHLLAGSEMIETQEDIYVGSIETDRGVREQVRFYDTRGLRDGMELPKHCFSCTDGYVLVYSTDSKESFKRVELLKKEIDKSKDKKEVSTRDLPRGTGLQSGVCALVLWFLARESPFPWLVTRW